MIATPSLDAAGLERVLQSVDPAARLVPARFLRRVIRRHFGLPAGAKAPHAFALELPRERLLALVGGADVGGTTENLLLLPLSDADEPPPADELLFAYWRLLFHAAVDRAAAKAGGFPDDPRLFNATVLHEIRTVLQGEHRLLPTADDRDVFREFAAFFLELRYFAPEQVGAYFPGFRHPDAIERFFRERFDPKLLFDLTRPAGAPEPAAHHAAHHHAQPEVPNLSGDPSLKQQTSAAAEKGNDVRAAVALRKLGEVSAAESHLRKLVERLRAPLRLDDAGAAKWEAAIRPLLEPACAGFWPVAGRLLYELQKACLDVERHVYAVNVAEWAASFGRKRIKRSLENAKGVNILRRLRAALVYSRRVQLSTEQRNHLSRLLHHAIHDEETRLRDEHRPTLRAVLDEVGLVPANLAERVARDKLVEELLDTLVARGFLKMSDLRDAVARNRLKLDDLRGPGEWLLGDPIIRANRKLALRMDGVYRRGEIYMRGLQRLTSLAFGTALGRLLVLWLILPFGGAYVLLEGTHHLIGAAEGGYHFAAYHLAGEQSSHHPGYAAELASGEERPKHHRGGHGPSFWTSPYTIGAAGLLLLGLLHWPAFRRQVACGARIVFLDTPAAVRHSPVVRGLVDNPLTRLFVGYLLTPLVFGVLAGVAIRLFHFDWDAALTVGAGVMLLTGTLFRTPWGRGLEERLNEGMERVWRVISVNFLLGLLTLILAFFRALFELIERGMYAVDEAFRFREGEGPAAFAFKLVIGSLWFVFAELFRFAWNLLIEPQINPIKHFPVVTVSHKLLLPLIPTLADAFGLGVPTTTAIVFGIPGIFGFLVWECKENWKLYRANRPRDIGPVSVGSHGERVRGLLRPGFHSGVVPKQFAKLRKAESAGNARKAAKAHHHIEHAAEAVHRLAERELVAYLRVSQRWGGLPLRVQHVRLATNQLRIELTIPDQDGTVGLSVEERGGRLIGSVEDSGWLVRLSEKQRDAFADALTELWKLAGVNFLREQVSAALGVAPERLDARPEGIVVLPRGDELAVTLDDGDDPLMTPSGPIDGRTVPLPKPELLLSACPVAWQAWVERWEADQAGKVPAGELVAYRVLPAQ
jgi:hypothetical protein